MKDLPLNMLKAFAFVYQEGGVRPAARVLRITHSAVSRHIHELENWMGVPLIEKIDGRRALTFTPEGRAIGKSAIAAFGDLDRTVTSVREGRNANSLVIQTTSSIAARWLLPRLPEFEAQYPNAQISILIDQSIRDIEQSDAHLFIRMGVGPWKGENAHPVMDDVLLPLCRQDFLPTEQNWKDTDQLANVRLIHDRDPAAGWAQWFAEHPVEGVNIKSGSRYTSSDLVLRAAEEGLGVALGRMVLAEDSVKKSLLMAPFADKGVRLSDAYWLIQKPSGLPRKLETAFTDWLIEQGQQSNAFLDQF